MAAALAGATMILVLVSSSTVVVVAFLLVRGAVAAMLFSVTFPLACAAAALRASAWARLRRS